MKYKKLVVLAVVLSVAILAMVITRDDSDHTHDDPNEDAQFEVRDEYTDEQEHEEGQIIELSEEQINEIGIELATAGGGKIEVSVSLPGEITFNANKLAHIVPTIPGIVRQVVKDVGDTVVAGEVIAWLESTELGEAKVQYLAKQSEVSCCSIELVRAQEVYDNTLKLLETLKSSPSLETLQKMNDSAMGMNRSLLVSSYAEFTFAKEAYLREENLYEISSKEDFLKAESTFKKADAQYVATQDSVNFEIQRNLLEARRAQHIREIELKAAERLLYILGLAAEDVNDLAALSKSQSPQAKEEEECNDPNCAECAAKAAAKDQVLTVTDLRITNEKLAWYPIRTPFDGTIIDKHITLGEVVGDDAEVFVVADLSSVWVDLHVYPKDLMKIKKGQKVVISAGQTMPDAEGVISYVGPVVGTESRTALARVVLRNSSRVIRPGLFVTAKVAIDNVEADVIVPKDAIQTLEGKKCVFIKDEHGFEPSFITLGQSNAGYVQVTSGLNPGQQYVTNGAFELKSKIITSTLDSHAGHGH
ncbi:MAG TPA: efflux RND transporter periplasmic adaptor subunit [Sedimentisphaerales bacterium]|nr:efflux RND transporter periplasmic adaptor subunit [Sedimentisphaerales bacterium]